MSSGLGRFTASPAPPLYYPPPRPFALASVTSSIVQNVIRTYPPSRPARFGLNAGVADAACMSIPADSIRLSQGCLPAVLFRFSVYAPHIYVRHIFFS